MFNHYSIYFKKFVINKCIFLLFSPLPVRHSKGLHSVPLFPVDLCRFPDEDEPEIFRTVELAHKIRLQVSVQRIVYFP